MKSKFYYLSLVSIVFLAFSSVINVNTIQAQEVNFDQKKCIQSLVKQGLNTEQAKIWCNYKLDCLKRSQKEGLPKDAAESVCDCTINEFRKRYNPQQFQNLINQSKTNQSIAEKLREVGETCFDNILYEE